MAKEEIKEVKNFKGEVKDDTSEESLEKIHIVVDKKVFMSLVDLVAPLQTEVKIAVTAKGLGIKAVDPAHVAMIDLSLKAEAFEEYTVTDCEIGVDLEKIAEVLKLAQNRVIIDYQPKDNRLRISLGDIVRRIGLIDIAGMPDPTVPVLQLPSFVILDAWRVHRMIKAGEQLSDHIEFTLNSKGLEAFAEGDVDDVRAHALKQETTELEAEDEYKSMYSLDFLKNITKGATTTLTLRLGTNNPCEIEYPYADGKGNAKYLLAPRIEEN